MHLHVVERLSNVAGSVMECLGLLLISLRTGSVEHLTQRAFILYLLQLPS